MLLWSVDIGTVRCVESRSWEDRMQKQGTKHIAMIILNVECIAKCFTPYSHAVLL